MDYNALHPYPRYGAAVALNKAGRTPAEIDTPEKLAPLVAEAIEQALTRYTVYTPDDPKAEGTTMLTFDWVKDPTPGENGQVAGRGYYIAPHVVTTEKYQDQRRLLAAAHTLAAELRAGEPLDKSVKLTRTIAPLVAKVNSGTASLSDPRTTLLKGALTALTTLTPDKAAAWSRVNFALIPDLPLVEPDSGSPLLDYVWYFGHMSGRFYDSAAAMRTSPSKKGGYKRPHLHDGNFPEAPSSSTLGALGVAASVGWWARHGDNQAIDDPEGWARRVLTLLAERPLLIVTYGNDTIKNSFQERFGHHIVGLAIEGGLKAATAALRRVMPTAADGWNDPKVGLFRMMTDRFLRLFTLPALRDFLAIRASYPAELGPVFETYFTTYAMTPLSPELVASARAYGAVLNRAAWAAASSDAQSDEKRRGASSRSPEEYKQRALVEFESAVQSAKTGPELLAKVGSRAGRLAGYEMPPEAADFMEAVASGTIPIAQARDLVTAFMRLGTWTRKTNRSAETAAANTPEPTPDEGPPPAPASSAA